MGRQSSAAAADIENILSTHGVNVNHPKNMARFLIFNSSLVGQRLVISVCMKRDGPEFRAFPHMHIYACVAFAQLLFLAFAGALLYVGRLAIPFINQQFMRHVRIIPRISRTMSNRICRARINPASGKMDWILEDQTYDFYQEIARSGYGDMLHDTERNILFHQALKNVIAELKRKDERIQVLDIGTGTGLLAMMAAAAGADTVTACEAFAPIAATAKKIIAANGFEHKIRLVEKRSTDMTADDLTDGRANILVAEVFDTELIGEGALRTFLEAHERLLKKNCRVIPKSGTVFVQVVNSELIQRWARAKPLSVTTSSGGRIHIQPHELYLRCPGNSSTVHDLQLDQLPFDSFTPLTEPIPIFKFDFEQPSTLGFTGFAHCVVNALADLTAHAVFMWWDLDMDGTGELILSTRPNWDKQKETQWRDHWMQAIYYLPEPVASTKGGAISVIGNHDEHSLWFDVKTWSHQTIGPTPAPVCECSLHTICSHGNMGFLNDDSRYQRMASALEKAANGRICLCISDCSFLPLFALKLGAKKVFSFQSSQLYHRILQEYSLANGVGGSLQLISSFDEIPEDTKIDCVFGDPFFFQSMLPWHNLHFWYKVQEARENGCVADGCKILPKFAHIKGIALESRDLWKIRAPVKNVEGFDLRIFDNVVQKAIELCDAEIEPQPLWEYPSIALSEPVRLATYDLEMDIPEKKMVSTTSIALKRPGKLNAAAFWVDWQFSDGDDYSSTTSTGLARHCNAGEQPEWNRNNRQGIYFFPHPFHNVKEDADDKIGCQIVFDPKLGDVSFKI